MYIGNRILMTTKFQKVTNADNLARANEQYNWKLFWVTTPDRLEDCFVVAKNSIQAAAYECGCSGFGTGTCTAEYLTDIPDPLFETAQKIKKEQGYAGRIWPDYGRPWLLKRLGATMQSRDGEDGVNLNGRF